MAKKYKDDQDFILTANDLASGDSVYWSKQNDWTIDARRASTFKQDEAEAMANIGHLSEKANDVVGAYVTAVNPHENSFSPVELRERHRISGPSIAYGAPSFSQDLAA